MISMEICWLVLVPVEPKLTPSGFVLPRSISSRIDFGPVVGLAATTVATSISFATGASSRSRLGAAERVAVGRRLCHHR
jgi:hypothetical protein